MNLVNILLNKYIKCVVKIVPMSHRHVDETFKRFKGECESVSKALGEQEQEAFDQQN